MQWIYDLMHTYENQSTLNDLYDTYIQGNCIWTALNEIYAHRHTHTRIERTIQFISMFSEYAPEIPFNLTWFLVQ